MRKYDFHTHSSNDSNKTVYLYICMYVLKNNDKFLFFKSMALNCVTYKHKYFHIDR